jgi:hypothetical protein
VRLAGLAPGPTAVPDAPDDSCKPVNTVGGELGILNNRTFTTITLNAAGIASAMTAYIICTQGILGKYVKQLETTLDDGNTDTCLMRVNDPPVASNSVATPCSHSGNLGSNLYTVCMGI